MLRNKKSLLRSLFFSLGGRDNYLVISHYPGDTRREFKMWGGASKSVFVLVLKICQHQFASKTLSC